MKVLILSVRSEHAYNILTGKKTLELRKSVPKGFKGWVYIYITKSEPLLTKIINEWCLTKYGTDMSPNGKVFTVNGKIPFRFWFDEYEKFNNHFNGDEWVFDFKILDNACVEQDDLDIYLSGKNQDGHFKFGYAWYIKNLDIFPKPMQLSDFAKPRKSMKQENKYWIHKPPQSYMYAWVKEELK
jgi:predicted transcriptional regulator